MCTSLADGGKRCEGIPNHIVNARRRVKRTYAAMLEAKQNGDQERFQKLAERFDAQVRESVAAERDHIDTFLNPYRDMSEEDVRQVLADRTSSEEFKQLLADREAAREALNERRDAVLVAKGIYKQDPTEENYEDLRQARDASRDAYNDFLLTHQALEEYKDVTALAAARLSELTAFEEEYEGDELGNVVKTVSYESGTREWLEQRQGGIGGSDVGSILKVDPVYGDSDYRAVMASKVKEISDEEVAEQALNNEEFSGAQGRGNAWEPLIAQRFAEENPNYKLIHSKASWVNKENEWQYANFDGILEDRETGEKGILEIKTASDASHWDHGVPLGYRAQVLHYLNATGFKYAHVAVLIDDHEFRTYRIEADEQINPNDPNSPTYAEAAAPGGPLESFWNEVKKRRVIQASGNPVKYNRLKSKFSWSNNKDRQDIVARDVAAFRDEDPEVVRARIDARIAAGGDPDAVIRDEYTSFNPADRKRDIVSIDLETSGFTAETGEIIEVGITRRNAAGKIVDTYQALFSVDERAARTIGTGMEDVHHISLDDIKGQPSFRDPSVQKRMAEIMGLKDRSTVMLAHNAKFEKSWLNQCLDGFHAADLPIIDTMHLSRYFAPTTADNKLASFAPRFGVPYHNAHRALADAEMTVKAFSNFEKEMCSKD